MCSQLGNHRHRSCIVWARGSFDGLVETSWLTFPSSLAHIAGNLPFFSLPIPLLSSIAHPRISCGILLQAGTSWRHPLLSQSLSRLLSFFSVLFLQTSLAVCVCIRCILVHMLLGSKCNVYRLKPKHVIVCHNIVFKSCEYCISTNCLRLICVTVFVTYLC